MSLQDIDKACKDFGVLYYLPTLISSPIDTILQAIKAVREFKKSHPGSGLLGMHLEGPFLNPIKKGAHSAQVIHNPTDDELALIVEKGRDIIKIMTIAPECFTDPQIRYLLDNKIQLYAGHSNMSYEKAMHYFDMGIDMVTHLYNAMSAFTHRAPGFMGAALERTDIWAPIILDGHHLHYGAARIAQRLKPEHLLLITDSTFLGRKIDQFIWGDFDASMINGTYVNKEGNLAGAAISMIEAMQNAKNELQISEQTAIEMATSRPARAIKMQDKIGYIRPGYPARFCIFDEGFKNMETLIL